MLVITMGDAAKSCYTRRNKDSGLTNEEDFQKCSSRQVMDDCGNGHSSKVDTRFEKRKGTSSDYGTSPRKGAHAALSSPNSSKNIVYNQGARINDSSKDQIKKWVSDNHQANSSSWREFKSTARIPVIIRPRKEFPHECESLGGRSGRRQLFRDLTSEDLSDRKGNSGNTSFDELLLILTFLSSFIVDCCLRLYGSSWSRFGFKNSDINLDIKFPPSMFQPDVLLLVQESLKSSESFIDVDADFHAKVPVVVCKEKQRSQLANFGLVCRVSAGNDNACLTTNHLAMLGRLEPHLVSLVIAFRHWATLCCVDHPEEGGLPPYVFALMVIFFLQQRKEPFLPVYLGSWIGGFSLNKLVNFNLKEVENNTVVWEYSPGIDPSSSKESSPKRGKVPLVFDSDQQCSVPVGQLWIELLRFYALEFNLSDLVISIRLKEKVPRESKDWPKNKISVEDPYSIKRNVARTLNSPLVYEYILHCLRSTYKYFALPHKQNAKNNQIKSLEGSIPLEPEKNAFKQTVPDIKNVHNEMENTVIDSCITSTKKSSYFPQEHMCEPSQVFIDENFVEEQLADGEHLGMSYEDSDCIIEEFISGDNEEFKPSCEETESGNEEEEEEEGHEQEHLDSNQDSESGDLAIPISEHDVETDSISDLENFQNVITALDEFGLEESGIPNDKLDINEESTEGTDELDDSLFKLEPPTQEQVSEMDNSEEDEEEETEEEDEEHSIKNQGQHENIINTEDELDNTYTGSGVEEPLSEEELLIAHGDIVLKKRVDEFSSVDLNKEDDPEKEVLTESNKPVDQSNKPEFFYEFNKTAFTKGKTPTVVCSLCKREGHLKRDCPEDFKKIELDPLPPLTSKFSSILDQVCIQCYKDFAPNVIEDQAREYIRQNLESFIRQEFPGTKLNLFGSSKNGFGFKQSDLDICMTIDGLETAEGLDCIRIIKKLARVLKKHSGLRNILPITTAKVPIVKFFHIRSGLEVDISLYNTLALHNTRLLSCYATIDPRVKYLCYTMKVFTKMCNIGDASRGSLSSYAYTLMVLYFLQQRSPPVIPVLQEICKEPKKPEILVDGWNVYFFDRINELSDVWSDFGKNKESIGELWLGLLRFYTEEFDFKEHVICIRRKNPFDLNHNLGAGLSRKMTNFIMKAFINGRRVFGTPVRAFPKEYPSKMEYFFDPEVLTEGELAPNDRCCRICGKIGHFMKDCPMQRKLRRRHDSEDPKNQRYTENKEKRSKDEQETPTKTTEREVFLKDGKLQICAPNKNKSGRGGMDTGKEKSPKPMGEKWKRQEDRDLREKRCFICGREGHIKKECPQHKGAAGVLMLENPCGTPIFSAVKHSGRLNQGLSPQEEKKKQKGKLLLSPQSGSLSSKYMTQGKASQKRPQQDS
ncbi:hypothetical protein E2320_017332 [Naja naja]|nr:hypothetical protein E2320_017332 [Naja naja]